jgi:IS6 family transposase
MNSSTTSLRNSWEVEEPTATTDPNTARSVPRVITVDKNAASPKASLSSKPLDYFSRGLRQVKYLNILVEQDHRFIKQLVKPGMGFFSFETAGRTLQGYECMHIIRKGQMHGVAKGDITGQVIFIARLFGAAS